VRARVSLRTDRTLV